MYIDENVYILFRLKTKSWSKNAKFFA